MDLAGTLMGTTSKGDSPKHTGNHVIARPDPGVHHCANYPAIFTTSCLRPDVKPAKAIGIIALLALLPVIPYALVGYAGQDFAFHVSSWLEVRNAMLAGHYPLGWATMANLTLGDPHLVLYPPVFAAAGRFPEPGSTVRDGSGRLCLDRPHARRHLDVPRGQAVRRRTRPSAGCPAVHTQPLPGNVLAGPLRCRRVDGSGVASADRAVLLSDRLGGFTPQQYMVWVAARTHLDHQHPGLARPALRPDRSHVIPRRGSAFPPARSCDCSPPNSWPEPSPPSICCRSGSSEPGSTRPGLSAPIHAASCCSCPRPGPSL